MGNKCGSLHTLRRGSASPVPGAQLLLYLLCPTPCPGHRPGLHPGSVPATIPVPAHPVPVPVIHPRPCHSLREGTSSSKLPHSPNSSPLTQPREPVGQAGLKITRQAARERGGQRARPCPQLPPALPPPHRWHSRWAGEPTGIPWDPPKGEGGGRQRHQHTFMSDASIACATSGPGLLVNSAPPARGPGGSQWGGAGEGGGR